MTQTQLDPAPIAATATSAARTDSANDVQPLRVYFPGARRGWGPRVWRELARETLASRQLIWRLFLRDFSAKYRQSALGVLWAVILPIIAVSTFVLLNRAGLFNVGDTGLPYPLFALIGLSVWQVFAGGLTACSNAIISGGSMVVKINFPKVSLVFAAMGQVVFELLVRLVLVALLMLYYRVAPAPTAVLLPLALLPLFLLTLGLGMFLALVNVVLRDVAHVVTLVTTFLLFLTPVVYPPPVAGTFARITYWNPVAALVTLARDLLLGTRLHDAGAVLFAGLVSIICFLFSWRMFHLVEPRIAERV